MTAATHLEPAATPEDLSRGPENLAWALVASWKLLFIGSLLCGLIALACSYIIKPTFTARTTFIPPQAGQGASANMLASLGALGNLAGLNGGSRLSVDLYATLLASRQVRDKLALEFKLQEVYGLELQDEVLEELGRRVRISVGRKDGLIAVEVDDHSPELAAQIANQHLDELKRLTSRFALTEAQQRRSFFEAELKSTRQHLATAQAALQSTGFSESALRAEPRAAAESYARLRAETTAAAVRLQALRQGLTDDTPEVQRQLSTLSALRSQLDKLAGSNALTGGPEYIARFREFKYQESLFELYARQFELARIDEAKEGPVAQVVDLAKPPQRKSKPKRAILAATATLAAATLIAAFIGFRWQRDRSRPTRLPT